MIGRAHSVEGSGTADGPGIRMVIFLSGCPMRCPYCHNPDTWDPKGGTPTIAEDTLNQYEQARPFYKKGGITVSGGEPLMQISFATESSGKTKKGGMHTCLDISGITFNPGSQVVMVYPDWLLVSTDLILLDIKHIDPEEHVKFYSQPQDNILALVGCLEKERISIWTRHVVVPGITDREEYPYRLRRYLDTFKNVKALDVLPYHDMGKAKYHQLGIPYPLEDIVPLPPAKAAEARKITLQGACDERIHCS